MSPYWKFIATSLGSLAISACHTDTQNPRTELNPHPKMRYELTLKIDGSPGPFDSVKGIMSYEVSNKNCVPVTGAPMNPMRIAPKMALPFAFKKVAESTYQAIVYVDYLQDENYFGLGLCHWSLAESSAELRIGKLTLTPYTTSEQFFSQQPVLSYFTRRSYFMNNGTEFSISGEPKRTSFPRETQDTLFSVTLTAKEASQ